MAKSFREIIGLTPSTASTSDSILVIIDAQNEYAHGHLKTPNAASTRKVIATLLEKYREASAPIVHIVHQTSSEAPVFTTDTELAQEFEELAPKEKEKLITKQHPGSFTGTDLHEFLDSTKRKKIVLTGYMAHVCVSTTARQAAEKGWDVVLVEDGIGDRDIPDMSASEVVKASLNELADAFGTVVQSRDIKWLDECEIM